MIGILSIVSILGETKRRILTELRENPSYGYELAKKLEISVTGIYQHLRDLAAEGLTEHSRDGRRKVYRLTPKGERLIRALEE